MGDGSGATPVEENSSGRSRTYRTSWYRVTRTGPLSVRATGQCSRACANSSQRALPCSWSNMLKSRIIWSKSWPDACFIEPPGARDENHRSRTPARPERRSDGETIRTALDSRGPSLTCSPSAGECPELLQPYDAVGHDLAGDVLGRPQLAEP